MTTVDRVAVIGAGTMGHGIAYVALASGRRVALVDADAGTLSAGVARIRASFDKGIERGKVTGEQRDGALARLETPDELGVAVRDADLVVEAVPERLELKRQIFTAIERHASRAAILASNTSSLSITAIAEALEQPERVIGMHFFNPVPVMRLVELVRGVATSDEIVERCREFARSLGKTPIVVRDSPGFATSRLGVVLGLEAIRMLEQGVASAEDIDSAMELGYNHPMGPLKLTDVVGLDVRLAIAEHLHSTLRDDTYRPPALLRSLVSEGKLGKKTGQGFYRWESER
ncbi:MAG TPA: 3-hydroxyacyl-CoA dehydrogenase family protein [Gemmatimonadaceae bacterium]|nr:3-hydroxyacyl-CoA dehydrogenase family protein [Gemmatimonadaceae bacterium]